MSFIAYDLSLLVLFIILISIFLYVKRENLGKEGPLVLYRTKWGVKLIDKIGKKYKKTLDVLSYFCILLGYLLMASMIYLISYSLYIYLTTPIVSVIRAPPVAPLIPYFPKLFGMSSIFPPFYFIYFLISILIVATMHEFAHGIFSRRYNVKIKSTGFAFFKYFPAVLGAFVEQDEKQMFRKNNHEQKAILSAGVSANFLTAILFLFLLLGFFSLAFTPSGIRFDTYAYGFINISDISSVNGITLTSNNYSNILDSLDENGLNKIKTDKIDYVATKDFLEKQKENKGIIVLYYDSPAINSNLTGAINEINGVKIKNREDLSSELSKYHKGDKITIKTKSSNESLEYNIILDGNPEDKASNSSWLGIGFFNQKKSGIIGKLYDLFYFKDPNVSYEPKFGETSDFIYYLLWWIVIINFLVASFNMLPAPILDGGRFFYLTILGITKSKKISKIMSSILSYLILLVFALLMLKWIFSFF